MRDKPCNRDGKINAERRMEIPICCQIICSNCIEPLGIRLIVDLIMIFMHLLSSRGVHKTKPKQEISAAPFLFI
jgi:hypothetical protein